MMNAIVRSRYGDAGVLQLKQIPKPSPAPNEILVRVMAAAVHKGDVYLVSGTPRAIRLATGGLRQPKADSAVGEEFAGVVMESGREVKNFKVGDEIYGEIDFTSGKGSWAEYVCLPETMAIATKPINLSFAQAAAVPVSGQTALQAVRKGRIEAGQKVLINGASGGVGSFAVQIAAKAFGAEVTAVCSARNIETAKKLGAVHAIDYAIADFTASSSTEPNTKYDVVIDIAGKHSLSAVRNVMTPKGIYLSVGGPVETFFTRLAKMSFTKLFASQTMMLVSSSPSTELLLHLKTLIEEGKVTPHICKSFNLNQAADALRHVADGHAQGKVVINVVNE